MHKIQQIGSIKRLFKKYDHETQAEDKKREASRRKEQEETQKQKRTTLQ